MIPLSAINVNADVATYSGQCGENAYWSLDETGKLTISGSGKFYDCSYNEYGFHQYESYVREICVEKGITEIPYRTFEGLYNAKSVTISGSVKTIGDQAFEFCYGIEKIILEDGIENIGEHAFGYGIYETIYIPPSVKTIGGSAFIGKLMEYNVDEANKYYQSYEGALYNKSKDTLISYPKGKSSFDIPDFVEVIGEEAFYGGSLENITFGANVKIIESCAFAGCSELKSVNFPEGIEYIGYGACIDCESLLFADIPTSVLYLGDFIFHGCKNLYSISVKTENRYYSSLDNCLYDKEQATLIKVPEGRVEATLKIPEGVKTLKRESLQGVENLTTLILPASLEKFEDREATNVPIFTIGTNLKNIHISSDNPIFCSIDGIVYSKDKKELVQVPGMRETLIIPESVQEMRAATFVETHNRNFNGMRVFKELKILNKNCVIKEWDDGYFEYRSFFLNEDSIIYGYKGSTAEEYANKYGFTFVDINYHSDLGSYGFTVREESGMSITGCTISINGEEYTTDDVLTYIDIPEGYDGDITISKDGYITSVLSASNLKKHNFITLYPETINRPVINRFHITNETVGGAYTDLLRGHEYVRDLAGNTYDIYLDVNNNGYDVASIYLEQGKKKIYLTNGQNEDVPINGTFNSDGGTIYICIATSQGKIYKRQANIVPLKTKMEISMEDTGEMLGTIDEDIDAVGGREISAKFDIGNYPISLEFNEDGSFKGTIGLYENESSATYHDKIKNVIKKNTVNGKSTFPTEAMKQLEKSLEDKGASVMDKSASFGVDVTLKVLGYVEGKLNPDTLLPDEMEIGAIMSVGGEVSYTQQSMAFVVPYYWTVEMEAELAAKLGVLFENGEDKVDISLRLPSITLKIGLSGELCLGLTNVVGAGGKLSGEIEATISEPNYDLASSVWKLNVDFELVGQALGFEGSFSPFGDHIVDYQIYPQAEKTQYQLDTNSIEYTPVPREYTDNISVFSANSIDERSESTFKTNTYTYSAPQIIQHSSGNKVAVWIDDDTTRLDINRTALYYSVYDNETEAWSEPAQIENDGTADFSPKLKEVEGSIYLLWNDCAYTHEKDADVSTVASSMNISYAKFDGKTFGDITSVVDDSDYMDVAPDMTVVDGTPVVVWVRNDNNDMFCQTGNTSIISATQSENGWTTKTVSDRLPIINSIAITGGDELSVYYSADTDGELVTDADYEIYVVDSNGTSQITSNDTKDVYVVSHDDKVYWNSNGNITDGNDIIECNNLISGFKIIGTDKKAVLYLSTDSEGVDHIYVCYFDGSQWGEEIELYSTETTIGYFDGIYAEDVIVIISNEISDDVADLTLRDFYVENSMCISDAFYDEYTLYNGGDLCVYADITNNGSVTMEGYEICAYANGEELCVKEFADTLASGETVSKKFYIQLPDDITFDEIELSVMDLNGINDNSPVYCLGLSTKDVSIENTIITNYEGKEFVNFSVVNRGIEDLADINIQIKKDSHEGETIKEVSLSELLCGTEEIVNVELDSSLEEGEVLYIVAEELENENLLSNNYKLAVKEYTIQNDIIEEEISYENVELNSNISVTIEDEEDGYFMFTPEEDGYYTFYSISNSDTYGVIYDIGMNRLASNDDGDDLDFKVEYYMVAGETYILQARYLDEDDTGTFDVRIEKRKVEVETTTPVVNEVETITNTSSDNESTTTKDNVIVDTNAGESSTTNGQIATRVPTTTVDRTIAGTETKKSEVIEETNTTIKSSKIKKAKKKLSAKKINISLQKVKNAKKYQIQISTTKKFKKKLVNKSVKKVKFTIKSKKIKNKKKFFVRVRVCKVVNGKKHYSKWSKAKKVTIVK